MKAETELCLKEIKDMLSEMTLKCAYLGLKVFKSALLLLMKSTESKHCCETALGGEEVI